MISAFYYKLITIAITDIVTIYVEFNRVIGLKAQMEPGMGLPRYLNGEIVGFAKREPLTASMKRHEPSKHAM